MKQSDDYIKQFENGKVSRRQFFKYMIGLGLSIPTINSILAAAGPGVMASTPVRGGRLRIAMAGGSQTETLDPAKSYCYTDGQRCQSLYNTLIRPSSSLTPEPELAESWEATEIADEWIFKLRKGVEWHNGRNFQAKDVVYSLRRILDPKTGSGGKAYLADVADLKAEDSHTVRIKLKRSDVDFPLVLTHGNFRIVPDGYTDFDNAIGTGPFKLKSFKPGHGCLLERNPNYWKSGLPYVDEVESFSIPDNVARVNALLAGDIHLLNILDPEFTNKIESSPGTRVLSSPSGLRVPFIMKCNVPPYDNPDVRLALKLLMDREKYNKIVYGANAQIGNDHPIAPIYSDFCDAIPQRQHDPEKARFLLKKAGVDGFTFDLHVSDVGIGGKKGALVYSDMAARAGVNVKVIKEPTDGFWKAVWLKKAFLICSWSMRPTASMQMAIAFTSNSSWNDTFWKRPDFDKLLLEARSTFDKKRRKELHCELQYMICDDGGTIIPSFVNLLDAASTKVKNIILHPSIDSGFRNIPEACWLES
ncbi:MAG: ABC transporter substrate-binding protein [Desulfobacula sp.]|nr:ABC transporter substrate-binding protein [Desulfobacula sp.]